MQASRNDKGAKWEDHETLDAVRPAVREMLLSVPTFSRLSPDEQQQIAKTMVQVACYMANPDGVLTHAAEPPAPGAVVARAQADDPVEATKRRLSQAPGQVGKGFEAGAVSEGVEQFGALVQKVDFPKFVGGLIQNVFQAIVDSSIQQMRAYGELLANVAKTVDEYARDNISENNTRDWLSQKYPDALGVEISNASSSFALAEGDEAAPQQTASLTAKGDDPEQRLGEISKDVGMVKPVTDISDPAEEARLVQAARLQMARGRQQLLASMVMLGINRIVVTDGLIHAKVIFDMRASDIAQRRATASMMDRKKETAASRASVSYSGWLSPVDASYTNENTSEHVATVQSAVEDTSESKAEVKAKLSGEVRVNFKSDYFPMEKMASPQMIAAIQGNSQPPEKAVGGA
jgi:hypothetical protein